MFAIYLSKETEPEKKFTTRDEALAWLYDKAAKDAMKVDVWYNQSSRMTLVCLYNDDTVIEYTIEEEG